MGGVGAIGGALQKQRSLLTVSHSRAAVSPPALGQSARPLRIATTTTTAASGLCLRQAPLPRPPAPPYIALHLLTKARKVRARKRCL